MPKLNRKLTDLEIRKAKPKQKAYKLYDQEGLMLLVRPSGRKVWQLPYKFAGKHNVFTIGCYDLVSAIEARKRRDEVKELIKRGLDPNQLKKQETKEIEEKSCNSFKAIAEDWYSKQKWSAKHAKNINSRLEKDVYQFIGKKPIVDVTVRDILNILKRIEDRGALDVARRINQYCTAIFDRAITLGLRDDNPALGRSKFIEAPERKNRLHLSEKELPEFLKELEAFKGKKTLNLMVKLLALTFVRPGELRGAKWEEVDFDNALWHIPQERMKKKRDHLVPLSKQALETIRELHQITSNTPFLFPGANWRKPISDVGLIKAVRKLTNDKATPHGFRHTASTILNEKGFNGDHIEAQLAHYEENKVRGVYNKALYIEQRREMMQWWADYLDEVKKDD